jgi:hypothetical protein
MMLFAWFVITDRMLDLRAVATEVLFLNTPGPILIVTPDGAVSGANPAALAHAADAGNARHLTDWPELAPHLKTLLQPDTQPMRTFALGNRRYDLRILPMEKPLDSRAEMGRVLVFNDVTERESLEARLAAERDYLQLLMQTTMTAIIAFDEAGCAIFANPEAGKLTRIPAAIFWAWTTPRSSRRSPSTTSRPAAASATSSPPAPACAASRSPFGAPTARCACCRSMSHASTGTGSARAWSAPWPT